MTPSSQFSLLATSTWPAAVITVVVPYLIVGISRYSFFAVVEPRLFGRVVLIGILGWGITAVVVHLAAGALGSHPAWQDSARATAQSHMPLGAAALAIYALSFTLQAFTASRAVAIFAVGAWFPAVLVAATAQVASTTWRRAVLPGIAAASVWGVTAGAPVFRLIGHLL